MAHRLSTIYHANQIIVLRDGEIAEQGTDSELLETHGLYARLQQAQWAVTAAKE